MLFTKEKHQFHEKSYIIKNTNTHTNNAYVRIEHLGSNVLLSHMGVEFTSGRPVIGRENARLSLNQSLDAVRKQIKESERGKGKVS